jgi:hypothetical protein
MKQLLAQKSRHGPKAEDHRKPVGLQAGIGEKGMRNRPMAKR